MTVVVASHHVTLLGAGETRRGREEGERREETRRLEGEIRGREEGGDRERERLEEERERREETRRGRD